MCILGTIDLKLFLFQTVNLIPEWLMRVWRIMVLVMGSRTFSVNLSIFVVFLTVDFSDVFFAFFSLKR